MRTVRDAAGDRYLLVEESAGSSLVRDPETGEERHVDSEALEPVDDESPLVTAARAVPEPTRRLVVAARDQRALGLLVELDARGPLAVVDLLSAYDLCESDLHGQFAEFRAAGLVAEREVDGRRGYGLTDAARTALDDLVR
ncbi:MAG: hypothetical protein ABEJ81_04395 [Haloferacaceae archaeon]